MSRHDGRAMWLRICAGVALRTSRWLSWWLTLGLLKRWIHTKGSGLRICCRTVHEVSQIGKKNMSVPWSKMLRMRWRGERAERWATVHAVRTLSQLRWRFLFWRESIGFESTSFGQPSCLEVEKCAEVFMSHTLELNTRRTCACTFSNRFERVLEIAKYLGTAVAPKCATTFVYFLRRPSTTVCSFMCRWYASCWWKGSVLV